MTTAAVIAPTTTTGRLRRALTGRRRRYAPPTAAPLPPLHLRRSLRRPLHPRSAVLLPHSHNS
ncbi:hypothetical protein OK074_8951 [Actinobacteria bacterium OK074]|nr:hypothetical protein OK074_8951 [Actinobacteria bacterium OK074]